MKYCLLLIFVLLTSCGGPSYRLQQEFTSHCISHGGVRNIENKGYNVYIGHCNDGYSIKGIQR